MRSTMRQVRVHATRWLVAAAMVATAAGTPATYAADLAGRWEGRWQSCTDQFQGKVNARITKCDSRHYECVFTGWAFKIMPYRYKVMLTACKSPETGKVYFKCERKLPFWGMYWMRGCADDCKFFARYNTDDHTGYFTMRRVCD